MHNLKAKDGKLMNNEESKDNLYKKQLEERIATQQETIKLLLKVVDVMHFTTNDLYFSADDYVEFTKMNITIPFDPKQKQPKHIHKAKRSLKFALIDRLPFTFEAEENELVCKLKVIDQLSEHENLYNLARKIYRTVNDEKLTEESVKGFFDEWNQITHENIKEN